jgi:hypothetical protein
VHHNIVRARRALFTSPSEVKWPVSACRDLVNMATSTRNICCCALAPQHRSEGASPDPMFRRYSTDRRRTMKNAAANGTGLEIFLARVGAPRSLRIAFGGRIVCVGSPRYLRTAFGGRSVRFGLGYACGPRRRAALFSHRVRRSHCSRRLAALSSHLVRRSHCSRRLAAT